jgi:hypothetical protein
MNGMQVRGQLTVRAVESEHLKQVLTESGEGCAPRISLKERLGALTAVRSAKKNSTAIARPLTSGSTLKESSIGKWEVEPRAKRSQLSGGILR